MHTLPGSLQEEEDDPFGDLQMEGWQPSEPLQEQQLQPEELQEAAGHQYQQQWQQPQAVPAAARIIPGVTRADEGGAVTAQPAAGAGPQSERDAVLLADDVGTLLRWKGWLQLALCLKCLWGMGSCSGKAEVVAAIGPLLENFVGHKLAADDVGPQLWWVCTWKGMATRHVPVWEADELVLGHISLLCRPPPPPPPRSPTRRPRAPQVSVQS